MRYFSPVSEIFLKKTKQFFTATILCLKQKLQNWCWAASPFLKIKGRDDHGQETKDPFGGTKRKRGNFLPLSVFFHLFRRHFLSFKAIFCFLISALLRKFRHFMSFSEKKCLTKKFVWHPGCQDFCRPGAGRCGNGCT